MAPKQKRADEDAMQRPAYNFSWPIHQRELLGEPLFWELVGTSAFQRLKGIRFLGGIDYLFIPAPNGAKHNTRYTRYQHSLGVARLALLYAGAWQLPPDQRRLVYSAALLHDIGHSPLSHSLEPVFEEHFGVTHHRASEDVITGRVRLGRELVEVLRRYSVDIEHLVALTRGDDHSFGGFFSGPINFDTIDGILRTLLYAKPSGPDLRNPEVVLEAALKRTEPQHRTIVDSFWLAKDSAYRHLINSRLGVLADAACQLHMRRNISSIKPKHYFLTEAEMFRRLPGLHALLTSTRFEDWISRELKDPVAYRSRHFFIDERHEFTSRMDSLRYRQAKEPRTLVPDVRDEPSTEEALTEDLFGHGSHQAG